MEGAQGDWTLYKDSRIDDDIRETLGENQLYMYGDPAYTESQATMGAFRRPPGRPMPEDQALFNKNMSFKHIAIEHAFGQIQDRWSLSSYRLINRAGLSPIGAIYFCAVLMTNCTTCLRGNQTSARFQCPAQSLEEYFSSVGDVYQADIEEQQEAEEEGERELDDEEDDEDSEKE